MTHEGQTDTVWRVYYERVRMPLLAMRWAIYPGILLLLILFLAVDNSCNQSFFRTWCVFALLVWTGLAIHAQRWLKRDLNPASAKRLMLQLKVAYAFEGALWGFLPWVTLDGCSAIEIALAMATNAGVAASRMMLLSTVPEVFLIYILVGGAVWVGKTIAFEGLPLYALGAVGLLYVVTLVVQAREHAHMLANSIRIRYENVDLLDKLNRQMGIAEAARQQAENANAAKSKFLAAASHDLRQPAHAQGLYLDILSRTSLDDRQRELLNTVQTLAGTSAEMLDTLLDYSRIEAGTIEPRPQNFALQPLLNQIEREFASQADAKGLLYRTRETRLAVNSDPRLVELILRNLVANAVRYTDQGGILLTCRPRQGAIELAVWDTGIGIPPEQQTAVFQEFLQLGNPERDRRKGFGLGLAIVAGLARRLDHRMRLRSRPGRGSVFSIDLPPATGLPISPSPLTNTEEPFQPAHLLVIDDDPAARDSLYQLLRSWGYGCRVAEGIAEAITIAQQHAPEAVITDYRLRGDQTGAEAILALRTLLGNDLPALLITGDTSPERIQEARSSGVPVLHKPVPPEVLRRELRDLLDRRKPARP